MATEDFKRKLSAILSADVKGYSRLMGEDEEATVRTITAYRKVITSVIQKYRGRVVDSPGDNILAEFVSVVDAVQSAVEIQEVVRAKNAELPKERRMEFRIGVNLGDVIQEGERIYGDGVNIAARVEGLAEPGGICISGSAYEQIENKLALGYDYIGEHTVKNIVKPIRVYRVPVGPETLQKVAEEKKPAPGWQRAALAVVITILVVAGGVAIWKSYRPSTPPMEVASEEKIAFPLPDKSSISEIQPDAARDTADINAGFENRFESKNFVLGETIQRNGAYRKVSINRNDGANHTPSSICMEYKLSDRGGAHLWNQKSRDLAFFSGISFYAKADREIYAVFTLRESNSSDHNIMDVWRKIFPVDTTWKEHKIYFTDLGRSANYAKLFPGGDGILSLDRVEAFSFAVGIWQNPPRSKGKICVDEISFF